MNENCRVSLREIDRVNFDKVAALSVRAEQRCFVADNLYSIAQAKAQPECVPLAIYCNETPVGFVMYCLDADESEWWVYRLMVDALAQGRGFGRRGLELAIDRIRQENARRIFISFEPDNEAARRLYESMGFVPDGRIVDGETVYRLEL